MTHLFVFALLAAAPDGGVARPRRPDAELDFTEAVARCREQLPACKHVAAVFDAPRHPCAGRGARCTEDLMKKATTGGAWRCECEACRVDADCPSGLECALPAGVVDACGTQRVALECRARPDGGPFLKALPPCPGIPGLRAPPVEAPDPAARRR